MTDNPLFSIIVVSYNASALIKDTVDSILRQTFDNYEIVVKDACSTDDTIAQIPESDRIRLFQSKDLGIYDGMNMAIKEAKGRFLHFLNCGDKFASVDVLERVAGFIRSSEISGGIIYGDCIMNGVYKKQPSRITPFFLYRTPLCHQSMFFSKTVFSELGLYDLSFRIAADYDCTVKAFKNHIPFYYLNIPICRYLGGGISDSAKGIQIKTKEYQRIYKTYYSVWERFKYELLVALSLRRLRYWVLSDKSPKFLREMYHKTVNKVNK